MQARRRRLRALLLAAGLQPRSPRAPTPSRSGRSTAPATPTPSPDSFTWTVDTAAPQSTILTHPNAISGSAAADFTFSGSDPGGSGVAAFECKLDAGSFGPCSSPQAYASLAEGSHTFSVRAIDSAGNPDASPDSFTWTVDTAAPQTVIDSTPHNTTNDPTPTFQFSSTEPGSSFECSIDTGTADFHPCTQPLHPLGAQRR